MSQLYRSPLRVYLCFITLAIAGILAAFQLPVSLFPNSSKPKMGLSISYGNVTADDFFKTWGESLEQQLRSISTNDVQVEELTATYQPQSVDYQIEFRWGNKQNDALQEVRNVTENFASRFPQEIRDSVNVWTNNRNSGFFALSFYSSIRTPNELFHVLDPLLSGMLAKVEDAQNPKLFNPETQEIRVELIPEVMATLQLFPKHVERAINEALNSASGGSITVGTKNFTIQMPPQAKSVQDLKKVLITTPSGTAVHLGDIARIDVAPQSLSQQIFKTNGTSSLILFATPKPDGNVKKMSEDILEVVKSVSLTLPSDIQYKVLVDPSEFIRTSIRNVFVEVAIGSLLAVLVLFIFIGDFRNIVTTAIEIPLSMILAFILMKMSGMNLNLISLGGLALSAGMNVDASVVVMENIFRHFEGVKGPLSKLERLKIITQAVAEVRFAVIASTITSLVVFAPLAFTSELTYAILGDLAKTVVFSHGFSAFVALLLVPTIRYHLMSGSQRPIVEKHSHFHRVIEKVEQGYVGSLRYFLTHTRVRWISYASVIALCIASAVFILPRLPREIVGKPDTDWLILGLNTDGHTVIQQMSSLAEKTEAEMLREHGSSIQYTFTQIHGPNSAMVMARLKDKKEIDSLLKKFEKQFRNSPFVNYWTEAWNPSEMPIPNPTDLKLAFRGGTPDQRALAVEKIRGKLWIEKAYPNVWEEPNITRRESYVLTPFTEQWYALSREGLSFSPQDLADLARVATEGRWVGNLSINERVTGIVMRYPKEWVNTLEDIQALPIQAKGKLLPLKALASVTTEPVPANRYRQMGKEVQYILGRVNRGEEFDASAADLKVQGIISDWEKQNPKTEISVTMEDPRTELTQALKQLSIAVALSIFLIFLTMVFQFGSVISSLLVLVSVPLGLVGVLISLFVFKSTLSLNSALGMILLNGIAVANSIILVDFMKKLLEEGHSPLNAAIEAGRKRMRPILMTSLTTILGMMPVALGLGEGGKVLQPLGIAVAGGLWISTILTLFFVPGLQVAYLNRKGPSKDSRDEDFPAPERPGLVFKTPPPFRKKLLQES